MSEKLKNLIRGILMVAAIICIIGGAILCGIGYWTIRQSYHFPVDEEGIREGYQIGGTGIAVALTGLGIQSLIWRELVVRRSAKGRRSRKPKWRL